MCVGEKGAQLSIPSNRTLETEADTTGGSAPIQESATNQKIENIILTIKSLFSIIDQKSPLAEVDEAKVHKALSYFSRLANLKPTLDEQSPSPWILRCLLQACMWLSYVPKAIIKRYSIVVSFAMPDTTETNWNIFRTTEETAQLKKSFGCKENRSDNTLSFLKDPSPNNSTKLESEEYVDAFKVVQMCLGVEESSINKACNALYSSFDFLVTFDSNHSDETGSESVQVDQGFPDTTVARTSTTGLHQGNDINVKKTISNVPTAFKSMLLSSGLDTQKQKDALSHFEEICQLRLPCDDNRTQTQQPSPPADQDEPVAAVEPQIPDPAFIDMNFDDDFAEPDGENPDDETPGVDNTNGESSSEAD